VFRKVLHLLSLCIAACALLLSAPAAAGQHPLGKSAQPAAPALSAFTFDENRIKGEKVAVAEYTYRAPLARPRLYLGKVPALTARTVGPREREDYGFTGKEADVEVGLTYFGKRWLVPQTGRWLSPDPLALHVPGKADLNLYAYVRGRVFTSVDPWGLDETSPIAGAPSPTNPSEPDPNNIKPVDDMKWEVTKYVLMLPLNFVPAGAVGSALAPVVKSPVGHAVVGGMTSLVLGIGLRWGVIDPKESYQERVDRTLNVYSLAFDTLGGSAAGLVGGFFGGRGAGPKEGVPGLREGSGTPAPKGEPAPAAQAASKNAAESPNGASGAAVANSVKTSPRITAADVQGKTPDQLKAFAREQGLVTHAKNPNKFMDPVTGKERLRLDQGHVDKKTGQPYNDPKAASPHVHAYETNGSKVVDPSDNNPHFPTKNE
jgi:RHS repeat-associated protein